MTVRTGQGKGVPEMVTTAMSELFHSQMENPHPEAPPGSGIPAALLRHLVWLHLAATAIAIVCWVQMVRKRGGGRVRTVHVVILALLLGLSSAGAGLLLGAALE
ncbi:hypothetical protein [Nocardia blacklockiae]|uniref:hypothetical protein n=1 Tax=Nocardia blacklockiae TaxID=480036 RepID=UPI0018961503|nr:hypothetical protein [Nocardia blacklockiae]MBF6170820.1 hypothetical protein [Nocardia blacklockiae]